MWSHSQMRFDMFGMDGRVQVSRSRFQTLHFQSRLMKRNVFHSILSILDCKHPHIYVWNLDLDQSTPLVESIFYAVGIYRKPYRSVIRPYVFENCLTFYFSIFFRMVWACKAPNPIHDYASISFNWFSIASISFAMKAHARSSPWKWQRLWCSIGKCF